MSVSGTGKTSNALTGDELMEKIEHIERLENEAEEIRDDIESQIQGIIERWLREKYPKTHHRLSPTLHRPWQFHGDCIHVCYDDVCMGQWDDVYFNIPIRFFTDTEAAFAQLPDDIAQEQRELEERKREEEREREAEREAKELATYNRLKAKFGNTE